MILKSIWTTVIFCVIGTQVSFAASDAEFRQLFTKLMDTADVDSDAVYRQRVARHGLRSSLTAPRGLRKLLNWKNSAGHLVRGNYRCEDGYIVLTWTGGFKILEEFDEAQPSLRKKIQGLSVQQAQSPTLMHAKRLFDEQNRRSQPASTMCFVRTDGDVIEEVIADTNGGMVGGRYQSSILVHWCVAHPFDGTPPSLDQLKNTCPAFEAQVVVNRDLPLLQVVENQPVFETNLRSRQHKKYKGVQGFGGHFGSKLRKPFVAELIKLGFALNKAIPLSKGGTQYMWHRHTDDTYANVITTNREDRVRLTYSPPRREPRKTIEVEALEFQHTSDRDFFLTAHQEIQTMVKKTWTIDPVGGWNDSDYFGRWFSTGRYEQWMWSSLQYDRRPPGRGVQSLSLRGSRDRTNHNSISSVHLKAKWCPPAAGWSARVDLRTQTLDHRIGGALAFALYDDNHEHPTKTIHIPLRSHSFATSKRFGNTDYSIGAYIQHEAELHRLAKSPESFRDTIVGWIDGVIKQLEQGLESGKAVNSAFLVTRQSPPRPLSVFAAVPPEPRPREPVVRKVSQRKLTDEDKKIVIQEAAQNAELQKKQLLEHYEQMHRALIQAFPVGKLVNQ